MSTTLKLFTYSWHLDEREEDFTSIRIYCLDENNKTISLRVEDFTPYCYLELPTIINNKPFKWNSSKSQILSDYFKNIVNGNMWGGEGWIEDRGPVKTSFMFKKKLYYCNIDISTKKEKQYPYLLLAFQSYKNLKNYFYRISCKTFNVPNIGKLSCKIHETDAKPILQLLCTRKLPTAGWIKIKGKEIADEDKITICDKEYKVNWKNLKYEGGNNPPQPLIMGMDIEVNSHFPDKMPTPDHPKNEVFQISCILYRENGYRKDYLLSLGKPTKNIVGNDVTVLTFKTEADLLVGYKNFVRKIKPNIIVGYNILGFDIEYMIERSKLRLVFDKMFNLLGFTKTKPAVEQIIKWSSSAYKNQEFKFLDAEGILHVDLLPLIKRDYKLSNYQLKTVSSHFIGDTKDPLDYKSIFKCYRMGMKGGKDGNNALGIVGKYCVKDSVLVIKLFEQLQIWVGLCEMAKVCNVPIIYLYTKGQQIKVYSQVYKKCMYDNRVVEKDGYKSKEDERYTGAYVFEPKPGLYNQVVPFDFSSLYPTTIIAYNIDFSTLCRDENVKDELCNIIEWEDHINCVHDENRKKRTTKQVICAKRRYRFIKSPPGVLPTLLHNLLDARSNTKKEMKKCKKKYSYMTEIEKGTEKGTSLLKYITVLNKRQLSFKVSANSMYGAMGVKRGYLPFLPGAMCTTAWGRVNIQKAAERLQSVHKGILIYGDTDSCYIKFPKFSNAQKLWDHCLEVEEDVSSVFPPPMRMAFEEVIYWKFLILTKKRYMYLDCGRDGIVNKKIGKKGVLLARRDNSAFIRNIYEEIVDMIFNGNKWDDVMYILCTRYSELCGAKYNIKDFIITKSVGALEDYKIREVPFDQKKRIKRLKDLKCVEKDENNIINNDNIISLNEKKIKFDMLNDAEKDYVIKSLPAHTQLAERMKKRGKIVAPGSRLEYVVTTMGGIKAKQFNKIEHPGYFKEHNNILSIEYLYYLSLLSRSMDELLGIAYNEEKFTINQYKLRVKKMNFCKEIKSLFYPKLTFD